MIRLFVLALAAAGFLSQAQAADFQPPIDRLITGYVRPATAAFADAAARLPEAVSTVCRANDEPSKAAFRAAFKDVVAGFSRIHFLRFGPLLDDDRLSRLAFMPDPRAIGVRQIRKLYSSQGEDVLAPESLAQKSVAVQGLTALQIIAFGKGGDVILGKEGTSRDFTCGYAQSIARNVAAIGQDVAADWRDTDGFSDVLLSYGDQDHRYRSSKEALETVFNALVTGLIVTRDQDLLPALGTSQAKAKPRRFPFSRSGNSVVFLSGEIAGIRDALGSMKLENLTPEEFRWIFSGVAFEFDNALSILGEMEPPLRETFGSGDDYGRIKVLAITVKSIRDTLALELAGALDLAGGFNALDGD